MTSPSPLLLSVDTLTAALRTAGALADKTRVIDVQYRRTGTGQLADSYHVRLRYDQEADAPSRLFAKIPSSDGSSLRTAARIGAYQRECRFYRDLLPHLDIRAPRCLGVLHDNGEAVGLLLEDLSERARPLDQLNDGTIEQVRTVTRQLAALQAPWWNSSALASADWFYTRTGTEINALRERYQVSWERHHDTLAQRLDRAQVDVVERLGRHCVEWAAGVTGPRTLVHQDLRLDNLLYGRCHDKDMAWLVDWQTLGFGSPAWDPAFLLGTALPAAQRREIEHGEIRAHREQLHTHGIDDWDDATWWQEYRRLSLSAVLAMVPAVAYVQSTARGFAMFAELIERGTRQVLDLDALEFLP